MIDPSHMPQGNRPERQPLGPPKNMRQLDDYFQTELNRLEFEEPLFVKSLTGESLTALVEIRNIWIRLWEQFIPFTDKLPSAEELATARAELTELSTQTQALNLVPADGAPSGEHRERLVACMVKAFAAGASSALEVMS